MNSRSLIVYRGRAGDRNTRGTAGAQMLGALLARRYGLDTTFVSTPQAPLPTTAWDEQLAAARGDLHAFADALRACSRAGHRAIIAMGRCAAGLATIPVVAERHPERLRGVVRRARRFEPADLQRRALPRRHGAHRRGGPLGQRAWRRPESCRMWCWWARATSTRMRRN